MRTIALVAVLLLLLSRAALAAPPLPRLELPAMRVTLDGQPRTANELAGELATQLGAPITVTHKTGDLVADASLDETARRTYRVPLRDATYDEARAAVRTATGYDLRVTVDYGGVGEKHVVRLARAVQGGFDAQRAEIEVHGKLLADVRAGPMRIGVQVVEHDVTFDYSVAAGAARAARQEGVTVHHVLWPEPNLAAVWQRQGRPARVELDPVRDDAGLALERAGGGGSLQFRAPPNAQIGARLTGVRGTVLVPVVFARTWAEATFDRVGATATLVSGATRLTLTLAEVRAGDPARKRLGLATFEIGADTPFPLWALAPTFTGPATTSASDQGGARALDARLAGRWIDDPHAPAARVVVTTPSLEADALQLPITLRVELPTDWGEIALPFELPALPVPPL